MKSITLTEETVFPSLNIKEGKAEDFQRKELQLSALKYKHFRSSLGYPEEEQMHHMMMMVSKLTEDELGELSTDDTAEISEYIFNAIEKYVRLGQRVTQVPAN
ncbi:hypothetical protein Psal006b_00137 [Piscirickettsia salmonis]|uniref:Mu-like prophage FluMu gp41 family protein n=1 Tax=Piscirickettsia salmonis TaxID=1238 RepID=A0A1L6TFB6_PISSA|nr:hypothetical protein [Piscirickettsia salmonis]ALB24209.1 mu-like prophage FluMu gp41 family protein [Piscirickettsia salmonis]ALT18730.1 hypothetical protein PSLF89_07875 [Piscirickettsia salmonis LF-89 = ATCC VR-1361]ALY04007.1 hypothetical protein AWE47_14990 [Piscirickettsia salmonis]AMA43571.1 hypothetical protein AWJ11_15215 [Piscirickettsia salmonis]AOS36040.1 hypothetical protein AVM72_12330 [Piscirickettsia salmonis]